MSARCGPLLVNNDRTLAEVTFDDACRIYTTVTHSAAVVADWINGTVQSCTDNRPSARRHIVGLEATRDANGNIVLLQLCAGFRCLIYQLLHRDRGTNPPRRLYSLLVDMRFCFVGVGMEAVVCGLRREYGFTVRNSADLGKAAARMRFRKDLRRAGLELLAREVMWVEMDTPAEVRTSEWWRRDLSQEQIACACADAFVSFQLGCILLR